MECHYLTVNISETVQDGHNTMEYYAVYQTVQFPATCSDSEPRFQDHNILQRH